MKLYLSALVVLMMMALPATAQEPCLVVAGKYYAPFDCITRSIDQAVGGSVVAACADTIRVCIGKPLPGKHAQATDSSPVRLYRLTEDPVTMLAEELLSVHWLADTASGSLLVIPDPPLRLVRNDPQEPIRYRLVVDCRFWMGPDSATVDTAYIDFWKQHTVAVRGVAVRQYDSRDITSDVVVYPAPFTTTAYVEEGVLIQAENTERYAFDHWECSLSDVSMDSRAATQIVTADCWPLSDTVVFTAFYTDATASVHSPEYTGGLTVQASRQGLRVTLDKPSQTVMVAVSDLMGRLISYHEFQNVADAIELPLSVPQGWYLAVVRSDNRTTVTPLILPTPN